MDALTMTTDEVAEALHTNRNKISQLRKEGLLKGIRLGKGWIYSVENVKAFIKEQEGKELTYANKKRTNSRPAGHIIRA